MRISDWSSDVCSSDLPKWPREPAPGFPPLLCQASQRRQNQAPRLRLGTAPLLRAPPTLDRQPSKPSRPSAFPPKFNPVRILFCPRDRKSVVSGKSVSVRVDLGGRRINKKKKKQKKRHR